MFNQTPMEKIKAAKQAIKNKYAWPDGTSYVGARSIGGYALRPIMADGEILCWNCVLDNWAQIVAATLHGFNKRWEILDVAVLWEGPDNYCAQCGEVLPTEYGDPESENDNV